MESIDSMESMGSMDSMEDSMESTDSIESMGSTDSMEYMDSAGQAWAPTRVRARLGPKGQAGP